MTAFHRLASTAALLLVAACTTTADGKKTQPHIPIKGPLEGHLSFWSLPSPEDASPGLSILETDRTGELIDLDLGFLGGFGAGLSGIRARVLPIELSLGTMLAPPDGPKPFPEKKDGQDDAE